MLKWARNISDGISKLLSYGAEFAICALVVLVSYSAISRYVFRQGVSFMEELGGLLLMAIAFLSFAYVYSVKGHIKINLVTDKLPRTARNWLEVVACVVTLAFLIIFTKLSWDFVYVSYQLNSHTLNAHIYAVPWMALMPVGVIVFAIVVLMDGIDKIHSILAKEKAEKEEITNVF